MEITPKSHANLEFIFQHYEQLLTYRVSDTYFMKLLYVLLSRAEESVVKLKIHHASVQGVKVSNTFVLPDEICHYLSETSMEHYIVQMTIHDIVFDLDIYTRDPLDQMLRFIQVVLTLCAKDAPLDHYGITFYMTPFKKSLHGKVRPIDLNTGFTKGNQVVIFRKEEWFKVFIHECFHLFCLDFHDIDVDYKAMLQPMFRVESRYLMIEPFCEFWARTLNTAFFSYWIKKSISYEEFERYFHMNLNMERAFGLVQMKHYLSHFNLDYKELVTTDTTPSYTESTEGFCYYVLTPILFFHFQQTMNWFVDHNETLLHFKRNTRHVHMFCHYLKSIYAKDKFLKELDLVKEYPESWYMSIFEGV